MRRILNFLLLVIFFLTSFLYNNNLKWEMKAAQNKINYLSSQSKKKVVIPQESEEIIYYYPNDTLNQMLKTKEKIPLVKDTKEKLNLILGFIKEKTGINTKYNKNNSFVFMDKYLEVENVYYNKGILYIDFNMDFRKEFIDKKHELYFTYSIVNSFTEIKGVEKIKFLILGKEVNEFKYYKLENFLHKYDLRG